MTDLKRKEYLLIFLGFAFSATILQGVLASDSGVGWWKNQPPENWPEGTITLGLNTYQLPDDYKQLLNWPSQQAVWMIGKGGQPGRCAGSCHMDLPAWHAWDGAAQARYILGEKLITSQFTLIEDGKDPSDYQFLTQANQVYGNQEATREQLLAEVTLVAAGLRQALNEH